MESSYSQNGNPTVSKSFRVKRDAENWTRKTEDEIIRGIFISQSNSEKTTIAEVLNRYLNEVTPTKKAATQKPEIRREKILRKHLGKYSLASLGAKHIAKYRDDRLASGISNSSVRLELALLSTSIQLP